MNPKFKYNGKAKNSSKNLKGGDTSNNFSVLNVYLNEKGSSVKILSLNFSKMIL